jgi:hypothetical protein
VYADGSLPIERGLGMSAKDGISAGREGKLKIGKVLVSACKVYVSKLKLTIKIYVPLWGWSSHTPAVWPSARHRRRRGGSRGL